MVDVLADGDGYSGRAPPVDVAPAHFDRDAIKVLTASGLRLSFIYIDMQTYTRTQIKIIYPQGHAAWVLGTAIKNQADLQTAALGSNAMEPLLRLLKVWLE